MDKPNYKALIPIGVFLTLYLGLGILLEYVLDIPMGFTLTPIIVVFLIALLVACLQNKKLNFDDKLDIMAKGLGDKNILTMILIFLVSGVFVGVMGEGGAKSVAYFMLSFIPPEYSVAVLFVVSAFVSIAMGTSVGTVTLIVPIAVTLSTGSGFSLPLCIGSVIGGAMFGDNLSFISDTTIAACNGQGCKMKDKFKENFAIALPAAIAAIVVILIKCMGTEVGHSISGEYHLIQLIPYIVVLVGGIIGLNVFVVLLAGIVCGAIIMLGTGSIGFIDMLTETGVGAAGMFETIVVVILVASICALIEKYGGFDALLRLIKKVFKGSKGGQLGMGLLVGSMTIATANNTVAIVMANPVAKDMAETYGISPKKAASILDTFSCISMGILPYGAQIMIALSIVSGLGYDLSAFDIIPNLIYQLMLLISSLIFIFIIPDKKSKT